MAGKHGVSRELTDGGDERTSLCNIYSFAQNEKMTTKEVSVIILPLVIFK
jgi:hypothetical protein